MFPQWQYDFLCLIIWSNWNSLQKHCRGLCLHATQPNKKTPDLYRPVSSSGSQTSSGYFRTSSLSTDFFFSFLLLSTTSMVVALMPFHPCWHAILFFPFHYSHSTCLSLPLVLWQFWLSLGLHTGLKASTGQIHSRGCFLRSCQFPSTLEEPKDKVLRRLWCMAEKWEEYERLAFVTNIHPS